MIDAIRGQPNRGLWRLSPTMALMSGSDGPLGPGFVRFFEGEEPAIFAAQQGHWWNFNNVDGRILTATLVMRPG